MKTTYEVLSEDPEFRTLLAVEALVLEAAGLVADLMEEEGVTKADLARRLNKSRAWITQLLSGKTNMTVRTLAEVSHALGAEVKLHRQRVATAQQTTAPARTRHYILEEAPASGGPDLLAPVKPEYAA